MSLVLEEELPEKLYVGGSLQELNLPASRVCILDTNILFPAIFPPKQRKAGLILQREESVEKVRVRKIRVKHRWCKEEMKSLEEKIRIVNLLESGKFKVYYPALVSSTYTELKNLERKYRTSNIDEWLSEVNALRIMVNANKFRSYYPKLSELFDENADFSIALASLKLGCDFASDDYNSFNSRALKVLNEMYKEKWGMRKRLQRHDSTSLLLLLKNF